MSQDNATCERTVRDQDEGGRDDVLACEEEGLGRTIMTLGLLSN